MYHRNLKFKPASAWGGWSRYDIPYRFQLEVAQWHPMISRRPRRPSGRFRGARLQVQVQGGGPASLRLTWHSGRWQPPSGIVNRSTYSVRTGTGRYITCYSTVPPCTALYEYVLQVSSSTPTWSTPAYRYVLFTPSTSTYRVRTSQISMFLVRTVYRIHDKSTYLRLKVQTFRVAYQYEPVRTKYILIWLFFLVIRKQIMHIIHGTN